MTTTFFFLTPMIYLSGFVFPIENMPAVDPAADVPDSAALFPGDRAGDLPEGGRARDALAAGAGAGRVGRGNPGRSPSRARASDRRDHARAIIAQMSGSERACVSLRFSPACCCSLPSPRPRRSRRRAIRRARQASTQGQPRRQAGRGDRVVPRSADACDRTCTTRTTASASLLDLSGRYADAQRSFTKAIQLAPDESKEQALSAMAVSYVFSGDVREAASFYRQVFDRQTTAGNFAGAAETANALGRVYLETANSGTRRSGIRPDYETTRRQKDLPGRGDRCCRPSVRWARARPPVPARQQGNAANSARARRRSENGC